MPQQFPIVPRPPGSPASFGLTLTMPPPGASTGGGECSPSGPYIATCIQQYPDADSITFVFAIHGLSESSEVEWTLDAGESGTTVVGLRNMHVLLVRYQGGAGGTVSAIVDGAPLGSVEYAFTTECAFPDES